MYQIKTNKSILEVLNIIIDSNSCTIQFPNIYSNDTIKETFSDNLNFSILVDDSKNKNTEYPYSDYIYMSEPTSCQIGNELRKQIILNKTKKPEPSVPELLEKLINIQNEIDVLKNRK